MTTVTLDADNQFAGTGLVVGPEPAREATLAGWRAEARTSAWQRFEALPMPARTDEAWRFSNAKALDLAGLDGNPALSAQDRESILARSTGLPHTGGRFVFANDELLVQDALAAELAAKGVIWLPLAQAAVEHADLVHAHFMQENAQLGSAKFAALHEARVKNGTFLYLPAGVELALPLEAYHWLSGAGASVFPHTLIVAGAHSKVTFVDYFASAGTEAGFACGVNDLSLAEGAQVTYVNVQQWSTRVRSVQINSTVVGRNAQAIALGAQFGGGYVRGESISHLRGEGGRSDMLSLGVADGDRVLDQRTLQIHEVPHTGSDLLYKNSLDDTARTVFSGLIRVAPGAHFTDAYQKVRNLLLSDEAEANSAPGLEIEADNVRCTHGATSGQVEEEELFYLLSRGIPRKAAQRLIVLGFLNEVLMRLPEGDVRSQIEQLLRTRFGVLL